ncbi:hypothetical protein QBC40DRAFT_267866 [Triangularia verruculosa]|uniref:Uncharacterized protein n=1 Tax=Triangularia verruculosa TaxID=2587418 RepID=A0AAN6XAI6_9PEZI|nr:hypothetical protein QBC40DRAFT_267866 [Triangularia verruculosa]
MASTQAKGNEVEASLGLSATTDPPRSNIHSTMWFLERLPLYNTEKPYTMRYNPEDGIPQSNFYKVERPITVKSMRDPLAGPFRLGECGFQLVELNSRLTSDEFWDNEKVQTIYVQEVKDLLKEKFGAKYVHVLDYAVRKRHESFPISTGEEYEYDQPTALAHIGKIVSGTINGDCIMKSC